MDNCKFWVLISDGAQWYSYGKFDSYTDAKKGVKELTMDWEDVKICLILE